MGIECLDQLGEVGERAGQPIDLVDDDHVDPFRLHVNEQLLQSRPIHRPAGKAAVIVTIPNQSPTLMCLALDVGLARFPLGVEGIEILFKSSRRACRRRHASCVWSSDSSWRRVSSRRAIRSINGGPISARSAIRAHIGCGSLSLTKPEEAMAVPGGPGHRLGDLGQAAEGLAVPSEALLQHHDPLEPALPFTHEQSAGLQTHALPRLRRAAGERSADAILFPRPEDPSDRFVEVAELVGLEPIAQHPHQ